MPLNQCIRPLNRLLNAFLPSFNSSCVACVSQRCSFFHQVLFLRRFMVATVTCFATHNFLLLHYNIIDKLQWILLRQQQHMSAARLVVPCVMCVCAHNACFALRKSQLVIINIIPIAHICKFFLNLRAVCKHDIFQFLRLSFNQLVICIIVVIITI